MTDNNGQPVEEFATVQAIFVRQRNCLMLRAEMTPLFVDYYLNLMQHSNRNAEAEDSMFKQLLAFFTLHLVSRPWQEYHAWTFNIKAPMLANYFVSGSSLTEDVVGRVFTKDVREPEKNMLFAQNIRTGKEPHTSVITLPGEDVIEWVVFEFVDGCVGALHVGLLVVGFKGRDYGVDARYEGLRWGGGEVAVI